MSAFASSVMQPPAYYDTMCLIHFCYIHITYAHTLTTCFYTLPAVSNCLIHSLSYTHSLSGPPQATSYYKYKSEPINDVPAAASLQPGSDSTE